MSGETEIREIAPPAKFNQPVEWGEDMAEKVEWWAIEPFGAEVTGIDLSKVPSPAIRQQLRQLHDEHRLLVFRGQNLTLEEQRRAAAWFGNFIRPSKALTTSRTSERTDFRQSGTQISLRSGALRMSG